MTDERPIELPERLKPELQGWFEEAVRAVRREARSRVDRYPCPWCAAVFVAADSLQKHLVAKHPGGR